MLNYDEERDPESISFSVPTAFGEGPFRLPCNVEKVWLVLEYQYSAGKIRRGLATREQAKRVAWRIIQDWLIAQMAIIESEMVTLPEIMLPYLVTDNGQTLYGLMVGQRLMLPEGKQ